MIRVLPADEQQIAALLREGGLAAPAEALVMLEGDACIGHVLFRAEEKALRLLDLRAAEEPLREALLRAALNLGQAHGLTDAVCGLMTLEPMLRRLGFGENDKEWRICIREFFNISRCH